jgi:predicted membrane-bound spermidine synthase
VAAERFVDFHLRLKLHGDVSMKALFRSFEQNLSGWPDTILSVALVTSGIAVILVGMFAPRTVKLLVLAWIWFP